MVRACLGGTYPPVIGPAMLAEHEGVLGPADWSAAAPLSVGQRSEVLDGLLNRCRWVEAFFAWRPGLPDETDNQLAEPAVAARAEAIATHDLRDVAPGESTFPSLRVPDAEQ